MCKFQLSTKKYSHSVINKLVKTPFTKKKTWVAYFLSTILFLSKFDAFIKNPYHSYTISLSHTKLKGGTKE